MKWRRFFDLAPRIVTLIGLPGAIAESLDLFGLDVKAHHWFSDMNLYWETAPFLFFGGLAAILVWMSVYKVPEWFPSTRKRFMQLEEPIRRCMEMMFAMSYSISEDPFGPASGMG